MNERSLLDLTSPAENPMDHTIAEALHAVEEIAARQINASRSDEAQAKLTHAKEHLHGSLHYLGDVLRYLLSQLEQQQSTATASQPAADSGISEEKLIATIEKWRSRFNQSEEALQETENHFNILKEQYELLSDERRALKQEVDRLQQERTEFCTLAQEMDAQIENAIELATEAIEA